MVKLLDPTGALGLLDNDRVIGKEDATDAHTKSLDILLGSERTSLIVDDSPAVWPQHAAQVSRAPAPPQPPPRNRHHRNRHRANHSASHPVTYLVARPLRWPAAAPRAAPLSLLRVLPAT